MCGHLGPHRRALRSSTPFLPPLPTFVTSSVGIFGMFISTYFHSLGRMGSVASGSVALELLHPIIEASSVLYVKKCQNGDTCSRAVP